MLVLGRGAGCRQCGGGGSHRTRCDWRRSLTWLRLRVHISCGFCMCAMACLLWHAGFKVTSLCDRVPGRSATLVQGMKVHAARHLQGARSNTERWSSGGCICREPEHVVEHQLA